MCGLAGFVDSSGLPADFAAARVGAMAATLAHRGPDGAGVWTEGPVAFGHRRLAVLDLSEAGAQPMTSTCGRYVCVVNGEIYNHQELRQRLAAFGQNHPLARTRRHRNPACRDRFLGPG